MNAIELIVTSALLGASLVAKHEALAHPPAELLENIDFLDDLPLIEGGSEAP
ncbi:MAG: hypothetical protein HY923_01155 [Elusimicrobia bacterium]|nr:hypothetical protein [Elusimicrobiota bacterium]